MLKATNDVTQAINNLLAAANVNALPKCDAAINQITNAANSLDLKRIQSGKKFEMKCQKSKVIVLFECFPLIDRFSSRFSCL